jgi:hypothetical protein
MFEIAGGIILAYVVIVTFPIWFFGGILIVLSPLFWIQKQLQRIFK